MKSDPDFFDAKIAGWWVWGICQWIGSGWCVRPEWKGRGSATRGRGIHRPLERKRPNLRKGGTGVNRHQLWQQRPHLNGDSGAVGMGIHSSALTQKMPLIGERGGGRGVLDQGAAIEEWFVALQDRLRRVRVCCGDWRRVLGPSPTTNIGVTAVFLDPPYDMRVVSNLRSGRDGAAPTDKLYSHHDNDLSAAVRQWAIENGDHPKMRIALCGYEGEHEMPATWETVEWKSNGGYGNQAAENNNAARERIWFSPHCLRPAVVVHREHFADDAPAPIKIKANQLELL